MSQSNKKLTRPFFVNYPDLTATGGMARVKITPSFDRIPSTRELVNTRGLAKKYLDELMSPIRNREKICKS